MDGSQHAGFSSGWCGMSGPRGVATRPCHAMRLGRPTSWLILLSLVLSPILPAAGAPSGAAASSTVDDGTQPNLHLQVISVLNVVHDEVDRTLTAIATAPAEAQRLRAEATRAWWSGDILRAATYSVVLLMIGAGAEWLYWCYAGKGWRAIAEAAAGRQTLPPARAATLGLRRAALSAIGATMFVCGVLLPSSLFSWPTEVQAIVVGAVLAITVVRVASIASELILAPHSARLRLVTRPDRSARQFNFAIVALSAALAGGSSAQSLLRSVLNAPGLATIAAAASGIVVAGLSLLVLHLWRFPHASGNKRSSGAVIYPIGLTTTVLLCLALHLLGAREIVSTALLWVAAFMVGQIVWPLVKAYTAATAGTTRRAIEYRPLLKSAIRIAIFGTATIATTEIWNIPLLQLSRSPTITGQLLIRSFNVIVVVLVVDLIWVWARTIIDSKLAQISARAKADGADPSARLATLLPLMRKIILISLLGLAGLTVLSALGIDIGPLLAGAGVVGIAIGLGAQTLVRDIVSGVFYLLADSFRVGEYIEFGEIRGTVEGNSLRFLRIRHHRGAVYTVPFGEIKWLINLSRDWAIMKLEFRVPFDTDLALVRRIVDKIGAELIADPEIGIHMIEPLESRGIIRTEEFNMVLSVKCMTKANEGRYDIRREAYQRIRDAFDEHGIRVAQGNVKVEARGVPGEPANTPRDISLHELSEVLHEANFGPFNPS
jgi:moderate conductance mechanosensitive channel